MDDVVTQISNGDQFPSQRFIRGTDCTEKLTTL